MKAAEAINFDTHKFVKRLTENGFTEQQAEALAEEQVNLLNSNLATKTDILALKADIEVLRQETKTDIEKLRLATKADIADVKADIERVKADLLKWMFGMMLAGIGIVVTLIKLLES